jgi:hypothetical protein
MAWMSLLQLTTTESGSETAYIQVKKILELSESPFCVRTVDHFHTQLLAKTSRQHSCGALVEVA